MADLDDQNTTYDSQQLSEEISKETDKAPKVNAEADYKRSKQFDVADIDRTEEGAKAADQASNSTPLGGSTGSAKAEGNPDSFRKMAKEVNSPESK